MEEKHRSSLIIAVFTAILAFCGALGGSFVSGFFSKDLWEDQIHYEQEKDLLNTRVELIKEVSNLANQASVIGNYQSFLKLQASIAQDYVICKQKKLETCEKPDDVHSVLDISNKRAVLNSRFASTLQMVTLFFGPETKKATDALAKMQPWWEIGEQGFRDLIDSMNKELSYGITHNKLGKRDAVNGAPS